MRPHIALLLIAIGGSCHAAVPSEAEAGCKPEPVSTPAANPHFQFWWKHRSDRATVPFQIHIAKDGTIDDVRIAPGDYHRDFAVETLKTLRAWRFKPFDCGPADGVWMQSTMEFRGPDDASNRSSKPASPRGAT